MYFIRALKTLTKDSRFLRDVCLPGFTGILHTWGRQLQFHPTSITSCWGGLSKDRSEWLASRGDFYVPVKALSPIFAQSTKSI